MSDSNNYLLQAIQDRLTEVEREQKKLQEQVIQLEKESLITKEKVETIYTLLYEIKDSVKDISTKLEKVKDKESEDKAHSYDKVKMFIITTTVGFFIGYLLTQVWK